MKNLFEREERQTGGGTAVVYSVGVADDSAPPADLVLAIGKDLLEVLPGLCSGPPVTIVLRSQSARDVVGEAILSGLRLAMQSAVLEHAPKSPRLNVIASSDRTLAAEEETIRFLHSKEGAFVIGACIDLREAR